MSNQQTLALTTTTKDGRTFELAQDARDLPSLRAHLIAQGFDGTTWIGESQPIGRQRGVVHALFNRTPAGAFVEGMRS